MTGDPILDALLLEWKLPDDAADAVRATFTYQRLRLGHDARDAARSGWHHISRQLDARIVAPLARLLARFHRKDRQS